MFHQTPARSALLILTLAGLGVYAAFGGYFAREIVLEIAILAILAISLDVAAGFGGMVSLFHGALMGTAAYVHGALMAKYGIGPIPAALAGIIAAGAFGALVGAITARTVGVFFIMATLAFGQMAYTVAFKSRWLGGDDGLAGLSRVDAGAIGVNLNDSLTFALFALVLVALVYGAAAALLRSAFGRTLCGARVNEARMAALGVSSWAVRTRALGASALLAGVAGVLAAQHTLFISPQLLHWTTSGEALIVVILGGLGTLIGPLIGAVGFVFLKHEVSAMTNYWHIVIGFALIAVVLAGGRGLYGEAERHAARGAARLFRRRARPANGERGDA